MINLSDTDVISIDSDDGSCGNSANGAVAPFDTDAAVPRRDNDGKSNDDSSDLSLASSSSESSPTSARVAQHSSQREKAVDTSIIDVDASIHLEDSHHHDENDDENVSSSSSCSSGIPSPWKMNLASAPASGSSSGPPSVIHTQEASKALSPCGEGKRAKKKCLTNNHKTIHMDKEDDLSCTDNMSTTSSLSKQSKTNKGKQNEQSDETKPKGKQRKPKKRQWGWNKKKAATKAAASKSTKSDSTEKDNDSSSASISSKPNSKQPSDEEANKHFHCYLLRSLDPDHPLKTYIGFTTHPQRRIRQHNGILKAGGARRTKRSGRPWTFVCVIHGFQDKITALQFEWAWQNVNKSVAFREAVGDDALAKKMKRRYGPKARLEELRILLKECLPFSLYSLTVYFPEREYHDIFAGILRRGKNGNPYKKDDASDMQDGLMDIEVCSLENMPVAREAAMLKEKKKAKKEAKKAQKKKKKGVGNDEDECGSDVSEWLENAKSMMAEDDSHWSNMLDDDGDSDEDSVCNNNLKTIAEDGSSIELCDSSDASDAESHQGNDVNDDISKDFLSLSIDAPKKHASMKDQAEDAQDCDFSTISSADSACSIDNDHDEMSNKNKESFEKENQRENQQTFDHTSLSSKDDRRRHTNVQCEVVDLCDSP